MSSGVRFRCYPNKEQSNILSQWIGHQRFIYNSKVDEDKYFRTFRNHSLSLTGQQPPSDQQYSQFKDKELTPFLYEVPSQILRNGAYRYMQACSRFRQGLAGRPTRKKKHGRQTVMITNELFQFIPTGKVTTVREGEIILGHKLMIGTDKFPVGELKFKGHRPYEIPKVITISRQNDQWHVSFSYAEDPPSTQEPLSEEKLLAYYSGLTPEELDSITIGGDRGVVIPMATSNGIDYDFTETEKRRLGKAVNSRKKLQKRMSRQQLGSKRRSVTKCNVGKTYTKQGDIRQDRAHKISHALVASDAQVFVFEKLPVKNMVKRPKPKKNTQGKYIRNGAAAKAGLNRAILDSMWGNIVLFTQYKGLKKEKLTIKVPPPGTSQECSQCGHTHPDNRETQAVFHCLECGFTANADHNAAIVIKKRGIRALLDDKIQAKKRKSVRFRKEISLNDNSQIGQGLPESKRASMTCFTMDGPGCITGQETTVSRTVGKTRCTLVSVNREAPNSTVRG
jgi:putative transposase